MIITWNKATKKAFFGSRCFDISCEVRNELNKRRLLHNPKEVVLTVTKEGYRGVPYMPRPFPSGLWEVTGVRETDHRDFAPIKILTTSHQSVEQWELDGKGGYKKPLGVFVEDYGYYLHWARDSKTTLGCGRVGTDTDKQVRLLANLIQETWGEGEDVFVRVSE